MSLRFEVVTDPLRFGELHDRWDDLWSRANGYIFQSHAWLSGWIRGIADQKDVRMLIGVTWEGSVLVGVMPCAVQRRFGLRLLQWAAQFHSDYCDCLFDQAHIDALGTLWQIMSQAGGFDLINLQQVRPDAQCRPFLEARFGSQEPGERQVRCLRIDNRWQSDHAFFRSLNKKMRNNHTRGKRILSEHGGDVTFEVVEPGRPIDDMLDTIVQWKLAWLRTADPTSPLFGREYPVFRALIDGAWKAGIAKLFLLTCGGKMCAASFNFVHRGELQAYLTAYDRSYERASPGTILIVEYAQWSFDRGLCVVDFLRGDEPFKFRLANAETVISGFSGARTLMGQVAHSGHRWLVRQRHRRDVVPSKAPELEEVVALLHRSPAGSR
jgi:CelD/BcsL family acetyltransferase involved in cellulose biosynthesis